MTVPYQFRLAAVSGGWVVEQWNPAAREWQRSRNPIVLPPRAQPTAQEWIDRANAGRFAFEAQHKWGQWQDAEGIRKWRRCTHCGRVQKRLTFLV